MIEADAGEVVGETKHRALDRQFAVLGVDVLGRSSHQETRDHDVDLLREDLLLDSLRGPRVELPLIEVLGLVQLVESGTGGHAASGISRTPTASQRAPGLRRLTSPLGA